VSAELFDEEGKTDRQT